MSKVSVEDVNTFFDEVFTAVNGPRSYVTMLKEGYAEMRLEYSEHFLRPGGIIAGPVQMSLADKIMYAAVFTKLGITPMAVTSNLNINFLRPCKAEEVIAHCELIKIGRKLAIGDVRMGGKSQMEAGKAASQAIVTYALPG